MRLQKDNEKVKRYINSVIMDSIEVATIAVMRKRRENYWKMGRTMLICPGHDRLGNLRFNWTLQLFVVMLWMIAYFKSYNVKTDQE